MGRPKGSKNKASKMKEDTCIVCNKKFLFAPSRKVAKFCSYDCYWKQMKGKESAFKGKHHSEEARRKIGTNTPKRFGPYNHSWKGGKTISLGYVLIRSPRHPFRNRMGYIQEHRIIMEHHLGRYLRKNEHIHHINGDKLDNKIENLIIMSNSDHLKLHYKERKLSKKGHFIS